MHIYDDNQSDDSGPVLFISFDYVDQSKPPQTVYCPPSCEALSITITQPTSAPIFQTTSRFIRLGGTATDDHGVAGITWANSTTGDNGEAELAAPRTNFSWTARQIPLVVGENIITVKAIDLDTCTASDEIIVTRIELPDNCWAFDTFDDLALGTLNGKNGWFTASGRSDAMITPDTTDPFGVGHVLELDPLPGQQIVMGKTITPQTDSIHTIELLVRVEPEDTSIAKLEVRTNSSNWDKKFQLYFGASMRLNYGPTQPEAIVFLPFVEPQRWYHVKAVVDLETDSVDIFLDDILVLNNIAVNPGPITMLSISAWDLPGSVLFDDIHGCKLVPVTHVELLKSPELPQHFSLSPNYPNPFNLSTIVRFALPIASEVTLIIYDLFGKEIRKLVTGHYEAGTYLVSWDGRNNLGRVVSSGVYFLKMRAGDFVSVNKMTLMK